MNENLTDMVNQETDEAPLSFPEDQLDIPVEEPAAEAAPEGDEGVTEEPAAEEAETTNQAAPTIAVTDLGSWFEANHESFPEVKQVRLQVTGVEPSEDLVLTVPHESGEILEGDIPKRRLMKIDDANILPVLNLPGVDMNVYNNGFRIISQFSDDMFLKCYGVKTGLIVVFCQRVDDQLLPYAKVKVGKKATDLEFVAAPDNLLDKGREILDKEALVLLYGQASGDVEELNTNLDAVKLLSEKQGSIRDINHHVQIDNALIDILSR